MTPLALVVLVHGGLNAGLDVNAPAGCVDPVEIAAALDEIGGIDIAEDVTVLVTPRLDEYALVVDIALAGAAPVHREVPLRPRECADVADLVAVLVQSQRRAALEARLLAPPDGAHGGPDGAPPQKEALPAMDPRTRPREYVPPGPAGEGWGPCDGPATCGGFRLGLSAGGAFPTAMRFALDGGWDVGPSTTIIAAAEAFGGEAARAGLAGGVAWRTRFDKIFEVSVRGLMGAGGGNSRTTASTVNDVECVPDASGDVVVRPISGDYGGSTITNWYFSPTVAVRGRIGYVFAEAGAFWHVNLDDVPSAYFAVGFAPLGI